MEIISLKSSEIFQSLQHLGYLKTCNLKYFQYRNCHKTQRLIPLTEEIEKAMKNFNGSETSTSCSDRIFFNTWSLVRDEVCDILQKLPISDQLIPREEIGDIIKKSLKDCNPNLQHVIIHDANDELEITVKDITEDQDKTILFVESIQNLERRLTKLEKHLKVLLKNDPKLRFMQAKKPKVNLSSITDKLQSSLNKPQTQIENKSLNKNNDRKFEKNSVNTYDDLFYTTRECAVNLLNYKKSLESLELNKRPKRNPYVKPTYGFLPSPQAGNLKKRSVFITS